MRAIGYNEFVEFCDRLQEELKKEADEFWQMMKNPKATDSEYESYNDNHYMALGALRNLRTLDNWINENIIEIEQIEQGV
jgi:hypothetical protein